MRGGETIEGGRNSERCLLGFRTGCPPIRCKPAKVEKVSREKEHVRSPAWSTPFGKC